MKKSFTLIELIVAIAIIAILAAIIAPNAFKAIEKAKISKALAQVDAVKTAGLSYYADTGQWPPWYDSFNPGRIINPFMENPDPANITSWDGPYVESYSPHPWGGHISWACNDNVATWENQSGCWVTFNDDRPNTSNSDNQGKVPENAMLRLDELVDDGNISTGDVREGTATPGEFGFFVIKY